ncbi:histidine phosphotransferase family protein [Primorskyibacter sp. S87]|uniref:histidine phosphotransferase family protein n=1 Tax=Primorskyibacter sp. S87 TaxID=3415126 RepID=UPI003C7B63DD
MGESHVNLAALIGSRICHDLISPIGAITNGLELLDLSGLLQGPEMNLIADSVGNAGARIRFFRIAFGAASEQELSRADVVSVLDDLTRGGRVQMLWQLDEDAMRSDVRIAFLALLCCENALPMGGELTVARQAGIWTIQGTGPKLAMDPALWDPLAQGRSPDQITPSQVQFALLPEAASQSGRVVATDCSTERLCIRF